MRHNFSRLVAGVSLAALAAGATGYGGFHFDPANPPAPTPPPTPPPAPSIATMREEFSRLQTEGQTIVDAAVAANRELTPEEVAANNTRFSRMTTIQNTIGEHARFASLALAGSPDAPAGGNITQTQNAPGQPSPSITVGDPLALADNERAEFASEARTFAQTGNNAGRINKRFATITTATGSGLLLPRQVMPPTLASAINPFRQAHTVYGTQPVQTNNTAAMIYPLLDGSAGGIVAENASSETENGGFSEKVDLTPKNFQSGSMWFSETLLAANDFDLLGAVLPSLYYSKELALESAIAAALIADSAITQTVTAATTATLSYANMVALNNKLPTRYGSMKVICLAKDAFIGLTGLVGSDGHPILLQDPQNQALARFNGTPVFRSDYLEAFGVTKVIGVVFSLMGFKMRDCNPQRLTRYTNQPGRPDQTGLNLFGNHGYGWAPSAVAKLVTPSS